MSMCSEAVVIWPFLTKHMATCIFLFLVGSWALNVAY